MTGDFAGERAQRLQLRVGQRGASAQGLDDVGRNPLAGSDRGVRRHAVLAVVLEAGRHQDDLALAGVERRGPVEDTAKLQVRLKQRRRFGEGAEQVGDGAEGLLHLLQQRLGVGGGRVEGVGVEACHGVLLYWVVIRVSGRCPTGA